MFKQDQLRTRDSILKKNISFHFTETSSEDDELTALAPHVRTLC